MDLHLRSPDLNPFESHTTKAYKYKTSEDFKLLRTSNMHYKRMDSTPVSVRSEVGTKLQC